MVCSPLIRRVDGWYRRDIIVVSDRGQHMVLERQGFVSPREMIEAGIDTQTHDLGGFPFCKSAGMTLALDITQLSI